MMDDTLIRVKFEKKKSNLMGELQHEWLWSNKREPQEKWESLMLSSAN